MPPGQPRLEQRLRLLDAAHDQLERGEDGRLQARSVTAAVGVSTQAIYTYFGGMPALLDAMVDHGFTQIADAVKAVPQTRDPVADFIAQGGAYAQWAFANPRLYRLMFGLGGELMQIRIDRGERVRGRPEGIDSLEVMVAAVRRMIDSGRIRDNEPTRVAAQFLAATHGYVLLALGGGFGVDAGIDVISNLAVNLLVGLGDRRSRATASLKRALSAGPDIDADLTRRQR